MTTTKKMTVREYEDDDSEPAERGTPYPPTV